MILPRSCCQLRFMVREWRIRQGKLDDGPSFGCGGKGGCHQHYRRDERGEWHPVSAIEEIRDLQQHSKHRR